ncbi:hypothetical protein J437_LFUL018821 [Ladona fulva]|uniref:Nose resistant to fluoxetine protein 6 n=1 Tax=Ladona fulva TaxID=123851 RepID=A0A8K0PBW3_LADFU|nr:hypothetical protein J437_LFUL018821 [Ladona fulva]
MVAFCWVLSTGCCLAVIFGAFGMMQKGYVYDVVESALYAGLHRTVWAIGLAWVIFACCHGHGGPVNTLLSWKAMAPLSRLTYAAYLSHFAVLTYNTGVTRTVGFLSPYYVVS